MFLYTIMFYSPYAEFMSRDNGDVAEQQPAPVEDAPAEQGQSETAPAEQSAPVEDVPAEQQPEPQATAADDDGDRQAEIAIDTAATLAPKKKRATRKPAVVV